MQALICADTLWTMATRGRRPGTPQEFQSALIARVKAAHTLSGHSLREMADMLSRAMGRPIRADTYRKWLDGTPLPLDAILPFCDITGTHPYKLLERPHDGRQSPRPLQKRAAS